MSEKHKILVVDDDPNIARLVSLYLEKEGYRVLVETRGDTAVSAFRKDPPALMLLDIMLPGMDGWQVCRTVRQFSNIPIIMLSAKDETFDKVLGLELGADDYITKPFEGKELVARVKAVLRRAGQNDTEDDTVSFPGLSISLEKYEVYFQGKLIEMPPKELEVLHFLASHKNRVFTREQLLEQVWGFEFFGDSRTVDVHIKRLREKLQDTEALGWQIRTVWGVGYKFEVK
ncbi:MAG: response regulator transcription factor [Clostridia bacterium]|nr:response regulator transcription factor [Clostridia bacterium]